MQLTARDRRMLIVLAGVVLVVALLYFFVLGGHKASPVAAPPTGGTVIQPGASPAASASPSPGTPILVFAGRDPFSPPPGALIGVASPTSGSNPTVAPAGNSSSAPGGGSSATVGGKTIVLDSIFTLNGTQEAQVEVDGTVYTVAVGGTFATNYKLTAINGSCADFTYKTSTTFSLCVTANK